MVGLQEVTWEEKKENKEGEDNKSHLHTSSSLWYTDSYVMPYSSSSWSEQDHDKCTDALLTLAPFLDC